MTLHHITERTLSDLTLPTFTKTVHPPIDAGVRAVRVVSLALLGTHQQRPYKGKEKPDEKDILITVEVLGETITITNKEDEEEELPRLLSRRMKFLGGDRSTFAKVMKALDPDGDATEGYSKLSGVLGAPVQVEIQQYQDKQDPQIIRNGLGQFMPLMQGFTPPEMVSDSFLFNFYDPSWEDYQRLPRWVQGVIKEAVDYDGSACQAMIQANETADSEDTGATGGGLSV